ncbi:hypothetical protein [Halomonas elongata]|uniref:hypothetical protein n=1 Tax=Halomonas elongata TaxID=2746 RepID=UPI0023AF0291|nr:hypothetical protein [Halomonas elongata]
MMLSCFTPGESPGCPMKPTSRMVLIPGMVRRSVGDAISFPGHDDSHGGRQLSIEPDAPGGDVEAGGVATFQPVTVTVMRH